MAAAQVEAGAPGAPLEAPLTVQMKVGVEVRVGVSVGVDVEVGVGVELKVGEGVPDHVKVGVGVKVTAEVKVRVKVAVAGGVLVLVGVGVVVGEPGVGEKVAVAMGGGAVSPGVVGVLFFLQDQTDIASTTGNRMNHGRMGNPRRILRRVVWKGRGVPNDPDVSGSRVPFGG